jgi:hypothetical protein
VAGAEALPTPLRTLSRAASIAVVMAIFVIVPAAGFYLEGRATRFMVSNVNNTMSTVSVMWMIASTMALAAAAWLFRKAQAEDDVFTESPLRRPQG